MGDVFSNIGPAATIINRSLVEHSINRIKNDNNEEAAEAIAKIAEAVIASGNHEAAVFFDQLNEELQKPEPRKTLLRASWENLVKTLPAVTAMAGAAGAIAKLFA